MFTQMMTQQSNLIQQIASSQQSLATSATLKGLTITFPKWEADTPQKFSVYAELIHAYKADPFFSSITDWTTTNPNTEQQSYRIHRDMLSTIPSTYMSTYLHNPTYLSPSGGGLGIEMLHHFLDVMEPSHPENRLHHLQALTKIEFEAQDNLSLFWSRIREHCLALGNMTIAEAAPLLGLAALATSNPNCDALSPATTLGTPTSPPPTLPRGSVSPKKKNNAASLPPVPPCHLRPIVLHPALPLPILHPGPTTMTNHHLSKTSFHPLKALDGGHSRRCTTPNNAAFTATLGILFTGKLAVPSSQALDSSQPPILPRPPTLQRNMLHTPTVPTHPMAHHVVARATTIAATAPQIMPLPPQLILINQEANQMLMLPPVVEQTPPNVHHPLQIGQCILIMILFHPTTTTPFRWELLERARIAVVQVTLIIPTLPFTQLVSQPTTLLITTLATAPNLLYQYQLNYQQRQSTP